jgi:hypothetical protein
VRDRPKALGQHDGRPHLDLEVPFAGDDQTSPHGWELYELGSNPHSTKLADPDLASRGGT